VVDRSLEDSLPTKFFSNDTILVFGGVRPYPDSETSPTTIVCRLLVVFGLGKKGDEDTTAALVHILQERSSWTSFAVKG